MSTKARLVSVAAAAAVVLAGSVGAAAPAAATWIDDGYYLIEYSGEIWYLDSAADTAYPLTYEEWTADGQPTPLPAPTDYVRYPWSSTISAVTFFGDQRDEWLWDHVSYEEWRRAGSPSPRSAGWIADSTFYQWETNSSEIFVEDVGGVRHKLTYGEWAASGHEPFDVIAGEGFLKFSWHPSIVQLGASTVNGVLTGSRGIGYDEWRANDFPTPAVVQRMPNDRVLRIGTSPRLVYVGPGFSREITYPEWAALGFPAPQR